MSRPDALFWAFTAILVFGLSLALYARLFLARPRRRHRPV